MSTLAVLILSNGVPGVLVVELGVAFADEEGGEELEEGFEASGCSADLFARCAKHRVHEYDGCDDGWIYDFLKEVIGDGRISREAGEAEKDAFPELDEGLVKDLPCTSFICDLHRCCCRVRWSTPYPAVLLLATQDE